MKNDVWSIARLASKPARTEFYWCQGSSTATKPTACILSFGETFLLWERTWRRRKFWARWLPVKRLPLWRIPAVGRLGVPSNPHVGSEPLWELNFAESKDRWIGTEPGRSSHYSREQARPFVGLDFHEPRQFFPLATVFDVEPPLSEAAVLASMKALRCRSEVFGQPLPQFLNGMTAKSLRTAEFFRRRAAPMYRKIRSS